MRQRNQISDVRKLQKLGLGLTFLLASLVIRIQRNSMTYTRIVGPVAGVMAAPLEKEVTDNPWGPSP
jgi:hypothetical protein